MSNIIDKRKRSREDDVFCDSTPLSKRINNLHLTNNDAPTTSNDINSHQRCPPHSHNSITNVFNNHSCRSIDYSNGKPTTMNAIQCIENISYNPELNESENPFYYVKNRLLHELHLERLKRCVV